MKSFFPSRRCWLWILFLIATGSAYGQQPVSYTINEKNNLPAYEAYQITQDSRGYIYIGCSAGLFRYDGFHYTPIPGKHQNGRAISHLQHDKRGTIWCQNFSGQIYQVQNDSLLLVKDYSGEGISFPQFTVGDSSVWILLKDRIVNVSPDGNEEVIAYPNGEVWQVTSVIARGDAQLYFTVFGKGLYRYDASTKKFQWISQESSYKERSLAGINDDAITLFGEQRDAKQYYFHTIKANETTSFSKTTTELNCETVYQWKKFDSGDWLCTSNGVFLYSGAEFNVHKFHLFAGEDVSSVYRDQEGNYWFTTLGGAIKVVPALDLFTILQADAGKNLNATACFTSPSGEKLIGTLGGEIFRVNQQGQLVELAREKKEIYRRVTKILAYQDLLLVSRGSLSIIDRAGRESIYKFAYIRDMALLGDSLYIINASDFGVFNLQTRSYTRLRSGSFRKLTVDGSTGQIAIIGNTGVLVYDGKNFRDVQHNQKPIYCSAIQFGSGVLWLATLNNGVMGFVQDTLRHHYQSPTLKGNAIAQLLSDQDVLYVASELGIQAWNTKTGENQFVGKRLHIDFQGMNDWAIARDTIYLATQRGYFYFPTSVMQQPGMPLPIALSDVTSNGQPVDFNKEQSFPHNRNTIRISFKSISYRSLDAVAYRYRLSGLQGEWTDLPGSTDQVVFESLKPSSYQFEVVAVNGDGVPSQTPAAFSFTILPPFWQRGWFILLFLIAFSSVITLIFVRRIKKIREQNLQQYRHIQSQLTALKAQMNPHFIHNALNSIQDLIIKHDIENSNLYLVKFSMLMRKVLEVSEKDFITIAEEAEILELYMGLEKLRFGSEFMYQVNIDSSVERDSTFLPPLLLQPFVENAIKHGLLHKKGERRLTITFEKQDKIFCTITDNGIGRKKSNEINSRNSRVGTSFATQATEKRINLLRQSSQDAFAIEIIDLYEGTVATGTKVIITIAEKPFMN